MANQTLNALVPSCECFAKGKARNLISLHIAPLHSMRFAESVQYLLGLGHETLTIKLGLSNTELLLQSSRQS